MTEAEAEEDLHAGGTRIVGAGSRAAGISRTIHRMSIATTRFVTGADRFAALHTTALPQVDELCGCFQAHLALRVAGFDVDQEDVALKAGTTQSPSRYKGGLPKGETGRDARCDFPITDEQRSGTAAAGMVRAIDEIGAGVVTAIPIAGPFTVANTRAVLDIACSASSPVTLAANLCHRPVLGLAPVGAARCSPTWCRATTRPARRPTGTSATS